MMELCHTESSFHAMCRPSNTLVFLALLSHLMACKWSSLYHVRLVLVRPELGHWYSCLEKFKSLSEVPFQRKYFMTYQILFVCYIFQSRHYTCLEETEFSCNCTEEEGEASSGHYSRLWVSWICQSCDGGDWCWQCTKSSSPWLWLRGRALGNRIILSADAVAVLMNMWVKGQGQETAACTHQRNRN